MDELNLANGARGHVTRMWPKGGGVGVGGGFTLPEKQVSTLPFPVAAKWGLESEQDTACSGSSEKNTGFRWKEENSNPSSALLSKSF